MPEQDFIEVKDESKVKNYEKIIAKSLKKRLNDKEEKKFADFNKLKKLRESYESLEKLYTDCKDDEENMESKNEFIDCFNNLTGMFKNFGGEKFIDLMIVYDSAIDLAKKLGVVN